MFAMPGTKDGQTVLIIVHDDDSTAMTPEMWTGWFASFGAPLVATGKAKRVDTVPDTPHPVVTISCERY